MVLEVIWPDIFAYFQWLAIGVGKHKLGYNMK